MHEENFSSVLRSSKYEARGAREINQVAWWSESSVSFLLFCIRVLLPWSSQALSSTARRRAIVFICYFIAGGVGESRFAPSSRPCLCETLFPQFGMHKALKEEEAVKTCPHHHNERKEAVARRGCEKRKAFQPPNKNYIEGKLSKLGRLLCRLCWILSVFARSRLSV